MKRIVLSSEDRKKLYSIIAKVACDNNVHLSKYVELNMTKDSGVISYRDKVAKDQESFFTWNNAADIAGSMGINLLLPGVGTALTIGNWIFSNDVKDWIEKAVKSANEGLGGVLKDTDIKKVTEAVALKSTQDLPPEMKAQTIKGMQQTGASGGAGADGQQITPVVAPTVAGGQQKVGPVAIPGAYGGQQGQFVQQVGKGMPQGGAQKAQLPKAAAIIKDYGRESREKEAWELSDIPVAGNIFQKVKDVFSSPDVDEYLRRAVQQMIDNKKLAPAFATPMQTILKQELQNQINTMTGGAAYQQPKKEEDKTKVPQGGGAKGGGGAKKPPVPGQQKVLDQSQEAQALMNAAKNDPNFMAQQAKAQENWIVDPQTKQLVPNPNAPANQPKRPGTVETPGLAAGPG